MKFPFISFLLVIREVLFKGLLRTLLENAFTEAMEDAKQNYQQMKGDPESNAHSHPFITFLMLRAVHLV